MIALRPYQREAVDSIFAYFNQQIGNPLIVLPTGAGKSLTMAAFIHEALGMFPTCNVLLITHVKELIEQDARAIIHYWPEAPIGIWSAGVGQKRREQITVAGIQSIHKIPAKFGQTDLVIIDEAHLVPRKSDTMYRRFLDALLDHNPKLKVIGLTATHYRMDSGSLTAGDGRIFTDVAYEADVGTLIKDGWLCPLVAKNGATKADLTAVHTRGGEYIEKELQDAMDKAHLIEGALNEVAQYAADRNHVLGFCSGVEHAEHCAERARRRGWTAAYVSGDMTPAQRDGIIEDFKAGRIRFLFNANLLTTGFDAPHIDCIIMLRPTKSTGLYVQIMGRGLRKHQSKENTLVLDFAGNIERHGPIDQIEVKQKGGGKGEGVSVAPVKECDNCHELVAVSVRICPSCQYQFPIDEKPKHGTEASDAEVIAAIAKPRVYVVDAIDYERHEKAGKAPSLKVTYWCGIASFSEWVPIEDPRSYVKKHAIYWFYQRGWTCPATVDDALKLHQSIPAPDTITVRLDGKYWRVVDVEMGSRRTNISGIVKEVAF